LKIGEKESHNENISKKIMGEQLRWSPHSWSLSTNVNLKSYIKQYLEYQIKLNNELLNEDLDFITSFEIATNE
ncbi:14677_t:CDS:2, partial [Gigaspora rosea]